jgi:hypothetical protein
MAASSRDRHPSVEITLLSDSGDGNDRTPHFSEPGYERNQCEDNNFLSTYRPRPRGARKSLRHTFATLCGTELRHPVRIRFRTARQVIDSVTCMRATSFLVKAECENDGTGRLEILLEQSLDR